VNAELTTASAQEQTLAPGTRVRVRDEEWLVQRVDRTSDHNQVLEVVGLSELVEGKEARFIAGLENDLGGGIEVVDPAETQLVADASPHFRESRLYMESLLRKKTPTDERLHLGHRAAMDEVPYQWQPALQALDQPRQRILIADATGLGKTLEAGVLMSDLIERGRGKRILVVALKSMMMQLQKEWWSRFTIPLVRLDSRGIQRIRQRMPTGHNPFFYYDKTIISIDTLKRGAEYRAYLENCRWDIVVIDEAQNAAKRGSGAGSQRHRLARLLAQRCDTMIMLSATPHDGQPRSFASLMNMLDPTAIANPDDYTREDVEGLFVRRFKGDIQDQVDSAFQERDVQICAADATAPEESAYETLADLDLATVEGEQSGNVLFRTTLEKALFSSPAACRNTVAGRLRHLEGDGRPARRAGLQEDIDQLNALKKQLDRIDAAQFSKYQRLLALLRKEMGWNGRDAQDRLVIFSERLPTLRFLKKHLTEDLSLPEKAVAVLHGGLSDTEQQEVMEAFGNDAADVRLLLASDLAAEGINLHYLCHRLIHFDIPWSLMVFQQRNGRIDRYGQERQPQIRYLVTSPAHPKIQGDLRILKVLIEKEQQAEANIEDPASLMGVYDAREEEHLTAQAIEAGQSPEDFEEILQDDEPDAMELLLGHGGAGSDSASLYEQQAEPLSLFGGDFAYARAALAHLQEHAADPPQHELDEDVPAVYVTATDELRDRFDRLPDEAWPEHDEFALSPSADRVQEAIRESRQEQSGDWPAVQYLWKLHPVMRWLDDKVVASFRRHEAPVLALPGLTPDEHIVVCSGRVPNLKGQPLVDRWVGIRLNGDPPDDAEDSEVLLFDKVVERAGLDKPRLPNRTASDADVSDLQPLVRPAVETMREWMSDRREDFEREINADLNEQLERLEALRSRHKRQKELELGEKDLLDAVAQGREEKEKRRVDRLFDEHLDWIESTMTTEDHAHIQVVAVLTGQR